MRSMRPWESVHWLEEAARARIPRIAWTSKSDHPGIKELRKRQWSLPLSSEADLGEKRQGGGHGD
jgi:hypothetical protein